MNTTLILITLASISWSCSSGLPIEENKKEVTENNLTVPDGFFVEVYAEVENARAMCLGEDGTVYVGSRSAGTVVALKDENKDGIAEKKIVIDKGLLMPVGVSVYKNDLYVSAVNKIYRYPNIAASLSNANREIVSDKFPNETSHGWKFIDFGPDGKLYVPVGAPCNICNEDSNVYANIMRMNPDGSDLEVFAYGVRNTVGFAWHPKTNELWFTDNGRDWLGDDLPPCELNYAPRSGLHFGYPFCHGDDVSDPKFGSKRRCDEFVKPAWNFMAHTAPLGMCFYTGDMFPAKYKDQAFVALHGSWNRSTKIGYEVKLVTLNESNTSVISSETFLGGLLYRGQVIGRPVDILQLNDGSILISDDHADKIYRVYYQE